MRSLWENDPGLCRCLDTLHAHRVAGAYAQTEGICEYCGHRDRRTFLDLCPNCFKAAYHGEIVRTSAGWWVPTDPSTMGKLFGMALTLSGLLDAFDPVVHHAVSAGASATVAQVRIPAGLHPDTAALVLRFVESLVAKLRSSEIKYGFGNDWADPSNVDQMRAALHEHTEKGDPLDVAAFCVFLWHHGASTAALDGSRKGGAS